MRSSFVHYCGSLLVFSSCHLNATHLSPLSESQLHLNSVLSADVGVVGSVIDEPLEDETAKDNYWNKRRKQEEEGGS